MRSLQRKSSVSLGAIIALCCLFVLVTGVFMTTPHAHADTQMSQNGERLITVHDEGQDKGILTRATTLRQAFKDANISIDPNDLVEPGLDEALVANNYEVNIYRARLVTIVDGAIRTKVMSPYQTAKQIADHAGITLHDEDTTTMSADTDMVSEGAGIQLSIKRATPFTLMLYGTKTSAYTQEKTVGAMLKSKKIKLASDDTLSVSQDAEITANMTVELWRNGKQTATEEQDVAFDTNKVQNVDQPIGYLSVTTPGEVGKKTVTYEIEMKNGQEVSRTEIQSVVTKQPITQVEEVGAKPSFGGDFAAALAKLRSCEGGYSSWNPAGYYGAYQFDRQTWSTVADSGSYGNATPAEQDQAARNLYVRRGWSPWPNCGRGLPDTYR